MDCFVDADWAGDTTKNLSQDLSYDILKEITFCFQKNDAFDNIQIFM